MREEILSAVASALDAVLFLKRPSSVDFIQKASRAIVDCFQNDGKLIIAGNGGSLCDAMHFAEELTGQFREKRRALPAIALACPGHMSCVANDMGYEEVFARTLEALGRANDVFVAMTTSGNSPNILRAVEQAKSQGMKVISFLGKTGGKLRGAADIEWCVEGFRWSDRIQEAHMAAIHIIVEMVESLLFSPALV